MVLPLVVVWGGTIIVKTPYQYKRYTFRKTVIAWVLAHFLYSVFFVLVLITRSSRERERDLTHRMKCGNMCVGTSAGKHNEFSTMLVLDSNLFLMT